MAGYSPAGSLMEQEAQGVLGSNYQQGVDYGLGSYTVMWQSWNANIYGTTAGTRGITYQNCNPIWNSWNQGYVTGMTTNTVTYNATVWGNWNQLAQNQYVYGQVVTYPVDTRTEEQILADIAAAKERTRAFQEQQKREADERIAAVAKARATLKSVLSKAQQEQLDKHNSFELQVNERIYRVQPGRRVQRLDPATKKVLSEFCIHPTNVYELPNDDTALSQKLLLEANEPEFLRLANETRVA